MKEFKFACPVCGQHITAASGTSGTQIECPTCFQKIIVPQERTDETKLILNAAMAERARPPQTLPQDSLEPAARRSGSLGYALGMLVLLGVIAGLAYTFREQLGWKKEAVVNAAPPEKGSKKGPAPAVTNPLWTLDGAKARVSTGPVAGMLRRQPFAMTRASLQGGTLSIRQGKGWPPELAVAILFPAKHGEELAGKKVLVTAEQGPPVPKVVLRWKDEQGKPATRTFPSGYLLRLDLGSLDAGKIPGSIFIALPDGEQSCISGEFSAELRAPDQPKKKKMPKAP